MKDMANIAAVDTIIHIIRSIALGGVVFFCLVGLDLLMGGHMMKMLGKIFNKRFDLDSIVVSGLSSLLKGTETKMMNVDEAVQRARVRTFLGVLILTPAVLLVALVLTRR